MKAIFNSLLSMQRNRVNTKFAKFKGAAASYAPPPSRAGEMTPEVGKRGPGLSEAQGNPSINGRVAGFNPLFFKRAQWNKIENIFKKILFSDLQSGRTSRGPKANPFKTGKVTRFDPLFLEKV